jgi:hypothetical protein
MQVEPLFFKLGPSYSLCKTRPAHFLLNLSRKICKTKYLFLYDVNCAVAQAVISQSAGPGLIPGMSMWGL